MVHFVSVIWVSENEACAALDILQAHKLGHNLLFVDRDSVAHLKSPFVMQYKETSNIMRPSRALTLPFAEASYQQGV